MTHEQGTGAWHQARLGKLTASRMKDAMDFKKDGKPSEARTKYMIEMVAERLTDEIVSHFVNPAMEWGKAVEPQAKEAYQKATGNKIEECFFFDHFDIQNFGASPDALVSPDGLLETKCPTTATHIRWVMADQVPEEHKPQMAAQILCTGRKWVDFVSFDPRIPSAKRLFIKRWIPEPEYLEKVEAAARKFLEEAEAMFDFMTKEAA